MAHGAIRLSRPARLGLLALAFAIVAAIGISFGVKVLRGNGGYQMGVHFPTAAGIAPGAQVFFNGVNIGTVSKVKILPDTTIDMILTIFRATDIPKSAKFSVQSTFTGSPTIAIVVPKPRAALNEVPTPVPQSDLLPKRLVPVAEQPVGSTPLTLEDVMGESKALGDRAYRMLSLAKPYGPQLLGHVRNARENGVAMKQQMQTALPAIMASLQSSMARAKANVTSAQTALRDHDEPKLAAVAASFERSARDMGRVTSALGPLKRDPLVHSNLQAAAVNLRDTTATMTELSRDMEFVTKNQQTRAELQDAGRRLGDILARLKSLI